MICKIQSSYNAILILENLKTNNSILTYEKYIKSILNSLILAIRICNNMDFM